VSLTLLSEPAGTFNATPPGRRLGVARRRVAYGRRATTAVQLNRLGRRLLAKEAVLEVRVVVTVRDSGGERVTQTFVAEISSPDR
jgi:hypothetical protein